MIQEGQSECYCRHLAGWGKDGKVAEQMPKKQRKKIFSRVIGP